MGTIVSRGEKYRAVVRVAGRKPATKTFDKHADAKAWIAATETGLRNYVAEAVCSALTLGAVMEKHRDEILRKKPYSVNFHDNTRFALAFADVQMIDMTDEWWIRTVQGWKVKANSSKP